ncbi:carbohydrate-binding protein [Microbacterium sp. NEAU-LLC]|uniref:Carbohydrate-binding protein n=1 Tax=Microbacterium helvum TaxID=2773713 RepID=A0ABR8NL01_9MICO|nr:carbohydrate-binding protein [Microbacterium helvum]MBD3940462.1 carbohydrate-binding protein [Microbacterium helvum]
MGAAALTVSALVALPGLPSAAAGTNIVANPGFESGTTGWSTSGATFTLSTDAASGAASGSLSGRANFWNGLRGSLTEPLDHDAEYRVTAKVKHTDGAATEPFGFAFCPASGACVAAANAIKSLPQGGWQTYTLDFIPEQSSYYTADSVSAVFSYFQFETPWSSTVPFLIDDVSLEMLNPGDLEEPAPDGELAVEQIQTKPVGDHNPLMGHKFGADPHHVVFNGRLYIYSTSDDQQYRTATKQANGLPVQDGGYDRITHLNVISTDDMVNWVDHGEVPVAGLDGVAKWAGNSWAPAAVSADFDGDGHEEVYLYFCNGGAGTGVIVGDSPVSGWTDPNGKMLISQGNPVQFPSGMWLFDPEIFIDDDEQPYLYFGGNWDFGPRDPAHPKSTRVVKLDENDPTKLADPTGSGITVIDGPGMFEASSMFKHDGKYYYSYSSNFAVNNPTYAGFKLPGQLYPGQGEIAYMVTDDPMNLTRDKFAGTAFASHGKWFPGSGGNNHSDMFEYKGKTYFAYHTQVAGLEWGRELNGGRVVNYRSVHLDELEFNEDGTIKEVVGTNAGVDQIQNFDPYRTFEAETLAWQLGVRTEGVDAPAVEFPEHNGGGNTVLTNIDDGDFTGISQADFADGAATVTARVKPLVEGGSIEVRLDSETGPAVATIPVDTAVGEWGEVSAEVTGASGVHDVFFVFHGPEGQRLVQVDNWSFVQGAATPAVQVTTSTRCVAGKVVLVATIANPTDEAVSVAVTTPYGSKQNVVVAAGKSVAQAFTTRAAGIPAGQVTVTPATGSPVSVEYPAATCG